MHEVFIGHWSSFHFSPIFGIIPSSDICSSLPISCICTNCCSSNRWVDDRNFLLFLYMLVFVQTEVYDLKHFPSNHLLRAIHHHRPDRVPLQLFEIVVLS